VLPEKIQSSDWVVQKRPCFAGRTSALHYELWHCTACRGWGRIDTTNLNTSCVLLLLQYEPKYEEKYDKYEPKYGEKEYYPEHEHKDYYNKGSKVCTVLPLLLLLLSATGRTGLLLLDTVGAGPLLLLLP
jgi:hypothetical protein